MVLLFPAGQAEMTVFFGFWVDTTGDLNGDGKKDFVIGAPRHRRSNQLAASYVIFGHSGRWPASIDLTSVLNGNNGFIVNGLTAGDILGAFVGTVGDFNGDGKDDLVIAGYRGQLGSKGYVIFGKASGWRANFDLSTLNGNNGFTIVGNYLNQFQPIGDLNHDGNDDFLATVTQVQYKPEIYLIYGRK